MAQACRGKRCNVVAFSDIAKYGRTRKAPNAVRDADDREPTAGDFSAQRVTPDAQEIANLIGS
jgi:hypothetical protein